MKFLALTAAAVSLMAAPAFAQDPSGVKLDLGGFASLYGSYVNQDEAVGSGARSVDILRDTEVHFGGETKLDNGLTVGAQIAAYADGGDNFATDQTYAFFSGNWGKIDLGVVDSPARNLQVAAPAADENIDGVERILSGINYDVTTSTAISTVAGELDYDQDTTDLNDKISYYTPLMGGFQAGLAYTPQISAGAASRGAAGNSTDNNAGDLSNAVDVAVRYEGEASGIGYVVGAGYTTASQEVDTATNDNLKEFNVGATVKLGDFDVGVAYQDSNNAEKTDDKNKTYVVGVNYTMGAVRYGASYLKQDRDLASAGTGTLETDRYTVGAVYNYGPGMSFRSSVSHIKHDGSDNTNDVDGTNVVVGTVINF